MLSLSEFILDPWVNNFESTLIIILMGFFVCAACGLIGHFIILRRLSMMGDAISHSVLAGIAVAFLITGERTTGGLFFGAILAAMLTVGLIEFLTKKFKVRADAAMGIVFSGLFSIGVVIVNLYANQIDLDTECVLYGEIAFVPLMKNLNVAGLNFGPYPLVRMACIFLGICVLAKIFYKELLICSFDPSLARTLGIKANTFHYLLTFVLSLVIVSAFKAVGAILVVGMLLFPGATGLLICNSLSCIISLGIVLSGVYSLAGFYFATWLDCSIAGAMTVAAFVIFLGLWLFKSMFSK